MSVWTLILLAWDVLFGAAYKQGCRKPQATLRIFFEVFGLSPEKDSLNFENTESNRIDNKLTENEILDEFRASNALLEGHFILSSGRHSAQYLQCARVLMDPARGARLANALVTKLPASIRDAIDIVVSPAMGGVIVGHEMGRALGKEAIFLERPEGIFELRRGFRLEPGQKVLMMEDVVTTGLSSREAIKAIDAAGGEVIAAGALVDRSNGAARFDVPFFPLIALEVPSYADDEVPAELAAIPTSKPGSRKI